MRGRLARLQTPPVESMLGERLRFGVCERVENRRIGHFPGVMPAMVFPPEPFSAVEDEDWPPVDRQAILAMFPVQSSNLGLELGEPRVRDAIAMQRASIRPRKPSVRQDGHQDRRTPG